MLYESITLTRRVYDAFLRSLDSKPSGFFEENVKSLTYLVDSDKQKDRILSTCCGITQLIDHSGLGMALGTIQKLRLHRASLNTHFFFSYSTNLLFSQAWADLTHLNVYEPFTRFSVSSLNLLPSLTHLSIISIFEYPPSPHDLSTLLATSPRLQSLKVFLSDDPVIARVGNVVYEEYKSVKDPRFMFMFTGIYFASATEDLLAILEKEWGPLKVCDAISGCIDRLPDPTVNLTSMSTLQIQHIVAYLPPEARQTVINTDCEEELDRIRAYTRIYTRIYAPKVC